MGQKLKTQRLCFFGQFSGQVFCILVGRVRRDLTHSHRHYEHRHRHYEHRHQHRDYIHTSTSTSLVRVLHSRERLRPGTTHFGSRLRIHLFSALTGCRTSLAIQRLRSILACTEQFYVCYIVGPLVVSHASGHDRRCGLSGFLDRQDV